MTFLTRRRATSSLTERFQTRFQSVRLQPPENEVLAAFLARRWGAPITITRQIAEGAKGNVRAAMADLEMWMGYYRTPLECTDGWGVPSQVVVGLGDSLRRRRRLLKPGPRNVPPLQTLRIAPARNDEAVSLLR